LDLAEVNVVPVSPNHLVDITLGLIIGLIGGVAFAILRQFLTKSFVEEKETSTSPATTELKDLNSQDVSNDRNKTALQANFSSSQSD